MTTDHRRYPAPPGKPWERRVVRIPHAVLQDRPPAGHRRAIIISGSGMSTFKSEFMRTVHARGMVHQCSDTERLDELLASETRVAYIGFDCTADSLHVGHLLQIMLLRWWQKTGHKPIALMGGGTTKVGDPSGRDASRQLLTTEQIAANTASMT